MVKGGLMEDRIEKAREMFRKLEKQEKEVDAVRVFKMHEMLVQSRVR